MFRRRPPVGHDGPRRGRGGGKVRERPVRKAQRRRMGMGDFIFMGAFAGVGVVVLEHFLLHVQWLAAVLAGVIVAVLSVGYQWWLERRRSRTAPPVPRKKRR